ncbi:MAG: TlpA family protein disulfide reductase [Bacteroidetes bacterium]|nr:MAG: TlpA family protein disulfide reductase [Bacteroidota bacterium]
MKQMICFGLAVCLSFVGLMGQKVGKPPGKLQVVTAQGTPVQLDTLKGKVVLIDFWASWCRPCRENNQALKPIYDMYKAQGFEIFAISTDADANAWQRAIAKDATTWLHTIEVRKTGLSTSDLWGVTQIPTAFLVNKEGIIVAKDPSVRWLKKRLPKLLKNKTNT